MFHSKGRIQSWWVARVILFLQETKRKKMSKLSTSAADWQYYTFDNKMHDYVHITHWCTMSPLERILFKFLWRFMMKTNNQSLQSSLYKAQWFLLTFIVFVEDVQTIFCFNILGLHNFELTYGRCQELNLLQNQWNQSQYTNRSNPPHLSAIWTQQRWSQSLKRTDLHFKAFISCFYYERHTMLTCLTPGDWIYPPLASHVLASRPALLFPLTSSPT